MRHRNAASILAVLTLTLTGVQCFSGGAPPDKCGPSANMEPSHGLPAQKTPLPYSLKTSATNVIMGQNITLTLSGGGVNTFKGFLVQAKTSDGSVVGTMVPGHRSHALTCGSASGAGGVTHTTKDVRSSVSFSWLAPNLPGQTVSFYATVVQDYSTYWVAQEALRIVVSSRQADVVVPVTNPPQPQTSPVSITTEPQETARTTVRTRPPVPPQYDEEGEETESSQKGIDITYDPECGSSKGCFVECQGQKCEYMVTWRDLGPAVQFEIYGKASPSAQSVWIAVGFSKDQKMGDDSVTECVYDAGRVSVYNSENIDYFNRRLVPAQLGLSAIQGFYSNGVLACSFIRDKVVPQQMHQVFNLEQDFNIMFAQGSIFPLNTGSLTKHLQLPKVSKNLVDFQSTAVIGNGADYPLVKLHGSLMIFAWVLFVGIGIVMARYYKSVWANKTLFKLKIWFQVHRACMIIALLLNIIAFIAIFVEVGGYSQLSQNSGYAQAHPILGIIITVLVIVNPVMALFRPGPDHERRPVFNWAHWAVGMMAYILSAVCICFGFQLPKARTPEYAVYIMIVYVIYIIVFDISFEVMECLQRRKEKRSYSVKPLVITNNNGKVESHEMTAKNGTDNGVANGNTQSKDFTRKNDRLKTVLIAIHVAITGAFAVVLVLLVSVGKH